MQHKLATWAEADPNRRFDRLLRLIADREWLAEAARIVLASSGARTPGIDGIDEQRMQAGLDRHLADLRTNLLKGTYCPKPVKRIYIPKANGKLRPLGIPTLTDRIVQRAMLMAMEPIWESDFHRLSYGFRPERSVHHAVRTVKIQLQDGGGTKGRWIIEGDLASYFDTVHHRLLLQCVRRRLRDGRFVDLLWRILKAGHIDRGLFTASGEGVPQGGVLSPLLSNIMLHEFDVWLEAKYLNRKARKDRWAWNFGIQQGRPITVRENRQWKPAVAYCRYADDFVVIVKGTKAHAMEIREECRDFLEGRLKLTLNMEKTHGPMVEVFGKCLEDPRINIHKEDVGALIKADKANFDAILLGVDNGPEGVTRKANNDIYSAEGLRAARMALRPGGVLAIWSSGPDREFTKRLNSTGFVVEEVAVRANGKRGGARYVIWLATNNDVPSTNP